MADEQPFKNPLKGRFVIGLAFDLENQQLALQEKKRPDWMAGQLNGPGGKIEAGETPAQAMAREFMEEASVHTEPSDWALFHYEKRLDGPELYFFTTQIESMAGKVLSATDEDVVIVSLPSYFGGRLAHVPVLYNLSFLIPMAFAWHQFPQHHYTVQ